MDLAEAIKIAGRLMPAFIDWVRAMRQDGKTESEMRRDIQSRRDEIDANRRERDRQFAEKFGPATEAD